MGARDLIREVLAFAGVRPLQLGGTAPNDMLERMESIPRWTLGPHVELVVNSHPLVSHCQLGEPRFELLAEAQH